MITRGSSSTDTNLTDILAVTIAGIFQVTSGAGPPSSWNLMTGVILLLVLACHTITPATRPIEILALSATWGFILLITLSVFLYWLIDAYGFFPEEKPMPPILDFFVWLFAGEKPMAPPPKAFVLLLLPPMTRTPEGELPAIYHLYLWLILTGLAALALFWIKCERTHPSSGEASVPAATASPG